MKKWTALILTMALMLCACAATAETFTYDGYYTIEYPDGWVYDTDDSADTDIYWYCGFFGGPGDTDLNFDARLYYEEDMTDFRLFDYAIEDEAFNEYAQMLAEWFSDRNLTYAGVIYSNEHNIPFIVMQGSDEYGPLIVVDTMANGWEFYFEFYAFEDSNYETCRELTDEDLTIIRQVIGSFKPVE